MFATLTAVLMITDYMDVRRGWKAGLVDDDTWSSYVMAFNAMQEADERPTFVQPLVTFGA